ncbi:MAG: efflux transporter outer membrane subunit [Simkaniaceae bacterium]
MRPELESIFVYLPKSLFYPLALLFLFAGCAVGPNYREPSLSMPEQFIETKKNEEAASLKNWWQEFEDPILDQIVSQAILGNLDLQIAIDRIRQARAVFFLERANLFPEIDLNADIQRFRVSQTIFESPFLGPPEQNFYRIGFDAGWELDFFGKLRRAKESAFYNLQAEGQNYRDVYISVISEAVKFYIEIRALQEIIALTEERIQIERGILDLTDSLFAAGLDSQTQLEEVKGSLASLEASLPDLQSQLKQNMYALSVILGDFPEEMQDFFSKGGTLPYIAQAKSVGIPCGLLKRRPDIRNAERNLAAATAEIGVAVADLYPSVTLTGSYAFETSKIQNWFLSASRAWNIGPLINWPLLDFGRIKSNIKAKEAFRDQAFHIYVQTILSAVADVESALAAYQEERKKSFRLQEETKAYEKTMELNRSLFQSGLADLSVFLQSEKTYVQAKERWIESQKQEMINLIAVYKAAGGDW